MDFFDNAPVAARDETIAAVNDYERALKAYDRNDLVETLAYLNSSLNKNPLYRQARTRKIAAETEARMMTEDIAVLRRSLADNASDHQSRFKLSNFLLALGYREEAKRHLEQLVTHGDTHIVKAAKGLW